MATPRWRTSYDLEAWRREGYTRNLAAYRFAEPRDFATLVEPERRLLIASRIATFGEHPAGLGKFTRTLFANDLRRTLVEAIPADTARIAV